MTRYDAVVIGAGQAGPSVAFAYAAQGRRVAVVEMAEPGGTCLNHGCRPTKALRASAVVAHSARRSEEFGAKVRIKGDRAAACLDAPTGFEDHVAQAKLPGRAVDEIQDNGEAHCQDDGVAYPPAGLGEGDA